MDEFSCGMAQVPVRGRALGTPVLAQASLTGIEAIAIAIAIAWRTAVLHALAAGLPWEPDVRITPLPEPGKTAFLAELIADAQAHGARVVNDGGGAAHHSFMAPAVVDRVGPGMRLYTEEQFGPVVPVVRFGDIAEPLTYIVESDYGQQISLFGKDPDALAARCACACQRWRWPHRPFAPSAEKLGSHDAMKTAY